jgi:hypothetical protein
MMDILRMHVREWVIGQEAHKVNPATIAKNKVILSAIFTTALNDQITVLHPCKGVRTPPHASWLPASGAEVSRRPWRRR